MKHGQAREGGRWCTKHGYYHGILYPCEHFSQEMLDKINIEDTKNRENWNNSEYIQKKLDDGMPPEGVVIMQMFAGLR